MRGRASRKERRSLTFQLILRDVPGLFQERLLFLHVTRLQSSRHTGAGISSGVHDVSSIVVLGRIQ